MRYLLIALIPLFLGPVFETAAPVKIVRVPDGGIQPQVLVDDEGTVHLVYFKGDPAGGDLYYARQVAGRTTFSSPIRINQAAGSAVAVGTIRGGQLAVGEDGRVHVVWNGSSKATPKAGATPLLYTRLNDDRTGFEVERNVITWATGLDGGSSVAAGIDGNVYVVWHAGPHGAPEDERGVYMAMSRDGGRTFERERQVSPESTGVCGCCGLRAFTKEGGTLFVLYRGAAETVHRDMHLLISEDHGSSFEHDLVDPWELNACPMSSAAVTNSASGAVAAWQTKEQVYFARVGNEASGIQPVAAPGEARGRKHPVLASRSDGSLLMAWTEGTAWGRGGAMAWQVYDPDGDLTAVHGRVEGVPLWSMPAAYVDSDGVFVLMY